MFRYFELAGNTIHVYNLLLLAAILVASLSLVFDIDQLKTNENQKLYLRLFIPIAIIAGLFGASFLEILTQEKQISFAEFNSGFTFYGGLILGLLLLLLYQFIIKLEFIFLLNFYTKALVLGHAIGRLGCFFAGCCFGKPTTFFLGVKYPPNSIPFQSFGSVALHPTQLYESALLFLLYLMISKLARFRFATYAIGYGICRFLLEFFRADSRGQLWGFETWSPSQTISQVLILMGLLALFFESKSKKQAVSYYEST